MLVSTDGRTFRTDSFDEIEALIRNSAACGKAEIWLSGDAPYPAAALLLNGTDACVTFFGEDEGEIKMSFGSSVREVLFRAGGEEWLAPANAVISLDEAAVCAEEFFRNLKLPACITWQDGV